MAQSLAGWEIGGFDGGDPGTDAPPDDAQDRVSDDAVGVAGAADADAARADSDAWGDASGNDWRSEAAGGAGGSANDVSQGAESGQRNPAGTARATPGPSGSTVPQQQSSQTAVGGSDSLAQPDASAASDTAQALRPRPPARQIGQIPILDDSWVFERPGGPGVATAAQFQAQHEAWMQKAQQSEDQRQQIAQINQSDPYISDEDGRWKKQTADPRTGAIHELDVLDTGTGKIDRGTGNIYVPTAQGPQVIGADPHQSQLAQIVAQKAQAQAQGSPFDAGIAATQSALLDTQRELQSFQGIPERLRAQIEKYSPISTDPNNSAAADQLQLAQAVLSDWKQQNPRYTALTAQRDALANQLRNQVAAKAQNDLQVAQLLTTPQYVQWNGNIAPLAPPQPVSLQGGAAGNFVSPAPASPPTAGSPPASDISIHDLDARAGVIAAQTGLPAGLAYASALGEAKQQGAQSVDGDSIDNAIKGLQPVAQDQLLKMTPPQLRQAFQSGLITRPQMQTTVVAQRAAQDQIQATADNGVSRPVDLAMRAFAENDRFLYRSGEYLSRLVSGDSGVTNWLKQSGDAAESLGKGEWGAVNPAFNKDKISQFASGLGDVVATAPAALATALALPEEGAAAGVMAAIRLGKVGMYGLRALPMALQFGAAGGAKAYDDTLASTGDRQKASDAATAGAWQAIKSAWPYLLVGGVAGLAEKAILPAVASPLLRGVTHAALSTVGNVVASGIGRAADGGNPWYIGQSIGQDMAWSLRGRLKSNVDRRVYNYYNLYFFDHFVWKAWDANSRTLLQQPHRFRMEADRTPASIAETLRTTSALSQARHPRRPLLRGAHGLRLAPASPRSAALAHRLFLLHDLAARRNLADNSRLPARSRSAAERKKKAPTAAIIDSQSVKTSNHGGVRGYDAGKKVMGRKRHLLVDTLGLILHVVVHPASIQDRDGAKLVLSVLLKRFGWLRCIFADSGYAGELVSWCKRLLPHRGVRLEIVKRSDADQHRFIILRKRWIVERTFGWLSKSRRLSKDYEYRTDNSEAMILIAATRLMIARLA